jgi:hypothetical protein
VDVAVETDRRPRAGDRSHALARALTAHTYGGRATPGPGRPPPTAMHLAACRAYVHARAR